MQLFTDQLAITSVALNNTLFGKGESAEVIASASGIDKLRYLWKKRGIDKLPNKVLGENTQHLIIPKLDESDEGQYYCVVTNVWNRSMESKNVTLTIYGMLYMK